MSPRSVAPRSWGGRLPVVGWVVGMAMVGWVLAACACSPRGGGRDAGVAEQTVAFAVRGTVSALPQWETRMPSPAGPTPCTGCEAVALGGFLSAVQGVGLDLLVVCGFAFDPHVSEEAKRYGKLTVLPTKMNPDLAMGDELLKKTGAGNLSMVFGEPDVDIRRQKDGRIVVQISGVDVDGPTTGQIRSSSTDDIACWFIDTDYDGESFFVRHACFTGADEPYKKLKRALRAEIDEEAWSALYSTVSGPFPRPDTGKIAVKVINHYGDEVLRVYQV